MDRVLIVHEGNIRLIHVMDHARHTGQHGIVRVAVQFGRQQNEEDQQWKNDECVSNRSVKAGSPLFQRYFGRAVQNERKNESIEHANDDQTQEYPHGDQHNHPTPSDEPIETQCNEYELQHVDGAKQFQLKVSIILEGPNGNGNGQKRNENQWNESQCPNVPIRFELVAHEQFKHEQQQLQGQTDEHGLEVSVRTF